MAHKNLIKEALGDKKIMVQIKFSGEKKNYEKKLL